MLEHNTAATDAYLPSLDAAILVTSADPPISKGERAFLERVAEQAVRLFVVLNKADYLAPDELERTAAFTERVVREVMPAWAGPIYALSARRGIGDPTGLARFAKDLRRFLEQERAAAVADAAIRSGQRAVGLLQLALDLERRAAELPAEEITRRSSHSAANCAQVSLHSSDRIAPADRRTHRWSGMMPSRSAAARSSPTSPSTSSSSSGTGSPNLVSARSACTSACRARNWRSAAANREPITSSPSRRPASTPDIALTVPSSITSSV